MNSQTDLIDQTNEAVLRVTAAYLMATRPTTT